MTGLAEKLKRVEWIARYYIIKKRIKEPRRSKSPLGEITDTHRLKKARCRLRPRAYVRRRVCQYAGIDMKESAYSNKLGVWALATRCSYSAGMSAGCAMDTKSTGDVMPCRSQGARSSEHLEHRSRLEASPPGGLATAKSRRGRRGGRRVAGRLLIRRRAVVSRLLRSGGRRLRYHRGCDGIC